MKVKFYVDLPDTHFADINNVIAVTKPLGQTCQDTTRYVLEVDLPIHHFKPVADRKIEAVLLGKEEK